MIKTKAYTSELLENRDLTDSMYEIISTNMSAVFEEAYSEDDKKLWYENNIVKAASNPNKKTVIAFDGEQPCAYFQYKKVEGDEASWDELEIDSAHKGDKKTFLALVKHFIDDNDFTECKLIRAYINNKNKKSQEVFAALGMKIIEDTPRGAIYRASRTDIENWVLSRLKP